MTEVIVRSARVDDLDILLELYETFSEEKPTSTPTDRITASVTLSEASADPDRHLVVAEVGGDVCGTADMVIA
jgi:hypothetical protein